jgi:3-dehydroquinate synthase
MANTVAREIEIPRTDVHVQSFAVTWAYPVYFTSDVFAPENDTLVRALTRSEPSRRHRLLLVLERAVAAAHPRLLAEAERYAQLHREHLAFAASPLVCEGGEPAKNDDGFLARMHARFDACGLDRQSFVVIVGGGALQDAVGFAAATAHRGLRVVRVPSTVLAQADGGVGVKNGVNALGKKNFLGSFAPPFAVIDDFALLRTLPPREVVAGAAEAVKVGLVRDASFFAWIERNASSFAACEPRVVDRLVRRAATLHLEHIASSGDPFELGSARPLDFGHWAAHKLEVLTDYDLRHGEAVAIGMAIDVLYSASRGLLDDASAARVLDTLTTLGLPLYHPALEDRGALLAGLREFREHLGGELTVTLLQAIGRGVEVHAMDEALVLGAIDRLREMHRCA